MDKEEQGRGSREAREETKVNELETFFCHIYSFLIFPSPVT